MRIARLLLGRYGHLSDVELEFPAGRGLHVVLGANEAGKSTALAAIGDGLFGFPHRTPYAFLHEARDLRIGMTLCAASGREVTLFRRKGRKEDLFDAAGQAMPEAALAAFLGGATRDQFERVFGLDAVRLREGGAAILRDEGEVGESILQALTGRQGYRALVDRLGEAASRLFGDRRGRREFHAAVEAFRTARSDLETRSIEPMAWRDTRAERDRLAAARAANGGEAQGLHAERARLDRIRRTAGPREALRRALAERAALGEVPGLPEDAEARRQAAMAARERAAHDLERDRGRAEARAAARAALVVDAALLAEGEAIDALAADRNRIAGAAADREKRRIEAEQHRRALEEAGRRLGQAADAASLAGRIPDALRRDAVSRAVTAHDRIAERWRKAREELEAAEAACEAVAADLAGLPQPPPSAALRAAIEAAKPDARVDAERAAAAQGLAAAQAALQAALAALPHWGGSAEALAAAPVPLPAEIARAAAALSGAETAQREAALALAGHDGVLAEIAADLRGLLATGALPTPEAIAAARVRRDRAWHLIRRHLLEGAAAPAHGELEEPGGVAALPDRFEALIEEADLLADRRAGDAERLATHAQLRTREARTQALRATAAEAATAAAAALAAAEGQWRALWQPAGIAPLDPAAMRDWLRQRETVLDLRTRATQAEAAHAAAAARHEAAWSGLAPLLPAEAEAAQGRLGLLLRAADRICAERERQEQARLAAGRQQAEAQALRQRRAQQLARAEADHAAWRAEWAAAAAGLGLAPDAPVEAAKLALELWNEVDRAARAWHGARDRIAEMTHAIERFAAAAQGLAARVGPDLAGLEPSDQVRELAARLADARLAESRHRELTAELAALAASMATLRDQRDAAEQALDALRRLAAAPDDAALQAAIERAARHAALTRQIAEREAELLLLDDGKPLAELDAEADEVELDQLPGRIAAIEERLAEIAAENEAHAGRLKELDATLRGMEAGHDAAAAAQQMHNALADCEDIAARYVRLRLAHALLRAGIERFRRQQQGPLLGRAGQIFARLTEGRYDRLGVDEAETGALVMVALRPDGIECPVERLSDGTRDQLYLALRLAAIEGYAARGEPLPFIADDLLVNFDDRRTPAALRVLAEFGRRVQTILFTHHAHIAALADPATASVHELPAAAVPAPAIGGR